MLHHQDKEMPVIEVVNVNVKAATAASAADLEHLQTQRKKANKQRKPYWQARIDAHFGLK